MMQCKTVTTVNDIIKFTLSKCLLKFTYNVYNVYLSDLILISTLGKHVLTLRSLARDWITRPSLADR